MRKILLTLLLCLFACLSVVGLTACGNDTPSGDTPPGLENPDGDTPDKNNGSENLVSTQISSEYFIVNDDTIYTKVSNDTENFDFTDKINVANGYRYQISSDVSGLSVYINKTVSLNVGDNVFYVYVININNPDIYKCYVATVRRREIYTVNFTTFNDEIVESINIEEDSLVKKPENLEVLGYIFDGWDFDFENSTVQFNTVIPAKWTPYAKYEISDDGESYYVSGANKIVNGKVEIAQFYNNLPVVSVKSRAFEGEIALTAVIIAEGVTSIESMAFMECTNLTSVTIPNSIKSMGSAPSPFVGCTNLQYNTYENAKYLGNNGNKYLILVEAINTSITSCTVNENCKLIFDDAFYGCSSLESITIPSSVTSIGNSAFSRCSSLESITIPSSVTSIGNSAFWGCSSLASITIPNSVTSIGEGAFYYCSSLESITIPSSVTSIGNSAFWGCSSLTSVTFGENSQLTSIGDYAFYGCSRLTSITIPAGVTSIGDAAFHYCESLTSVTFGENSQLTSIGEDAFSGCRSLTSITIGNSVTSIGAYAFYNCDSLESITLPFVGNTLNGTSNTYFGYIFGANHYGPNSIFVPKSLKTVVITGGESIGEYAFYDCDSLTSITIPNSVTSIGDYAFSYCSNLQYNEYDNGLYLGNSDNKYLVLVKASDTSITSCIINENCKVIGSYAFSGCSSLTSITVDSDNQNYSSENGVLYNKDKTTLVQFPAGKTNTQFTIPDSVTSIGKYAFWGCYRIIEVINKSSLNITTTSYGLNALKVLTNEPLQSNFIKKDNFVFYNNNGNYYLLSYTGNEAELVLPKDIEGNSYIIYKNAFYDCDSLTSITIPDSVTSIGVDAFYGCSSLTSVTFGENSQLTSIGIGAFYDCDSLTSITIPNSVTSIGIGAFYDCDSLTSITIPNSVTSIGIDAFSSCSSLTSITIPDSVTSIGNSAFSGCSSLKSITIGSGVATIGNDAFEDCDSLTSITIPEGVTSIGEYAFYKCSSLTSITIPNSVTSIGNGAFSGCYKLVEVINKSSLTIEKGSSSNGYVGYYALQVLTSEPATNNFIEKDDYLFYNDNETYYLLGYNGTSTSLILPNNINGENYSINQYAFHKCSSLTSITIPESVTSIGWYAFYKCSNLTSINFNGTIEQWNSISKGSYWNSYTGNYTIYCTDGEIA